MKIANESDYTMENGLGDLESFLNPIDGSLSESTREIAILAYKDRVLYEGLSPKVAFERTVNDVWQDRDTDETIREHMKELCDPEKLPATWNMLQIVYLELRETFCPYIAFQLHIGWVQRNADTVAGWLATEEAANKLIAIGMPAEVAIEFAQYLVGE